MIEPSSPLIISDDDDMLRVTGEIDAHSAPILASAIAGAPQTNLQLDLSGVDFIDSSGLRVLVQAHQDRDARGGVLRIVNASAVVRRLLDISGVAPILAVD